MGWGAGRGGGGHRAEGGGGRRQDRHEGDGLCRDPIRAESGEEDAGKATEPLPRERPICGRDGRDRVGDAERVAREDQYREPRSACDDHPGGQGRNRDAGHRKDQPKASFIEQSEVPDPTAPRKGSRSVDLIRPASPIIDLVDRVRFPSLDEAAEGQGDHEPSAVESTDVANGDCGTEDDRGVGPQQHGDETELQEPPFRGPEQGASSPHERHHFDYFDSNIRTFVNRVFDACPATYFIAKRMGAPPHGPAVMVSLRREPPRGRTPTDSFFSPLSHPQPRRHPHPPRLVLPNKSPPPPRAPRERLRDDARGRGLRHPVLALPAAPGPFRGLSRNLASNWASLGGKVDMVWADVSQV